MTGERTTVGGSSSEDVPVTLDSWQHVAGPFFHGTRAALKTGDELVPGLGSNYQQGRTSNNIYVTSRLETAVRGAELSTALAGTGERGRVYVVEPSGPFEDDPDVTDERFPGNPTRSYRSRLPLRVVGEVADWPGTSRRSWPGCSTRWDDCASGARTSPRTEDVLRGPGTANQDGDRRWSPATGSCATGPAPRSWWRSSRRGWRPAPSPGPRASLRT